MMRQNAELQQRQSSLERRAAYQKSLLAANRDQMQACSNPDFSPVHTFIQLNERSFAFAASHRYRKCVAHWRHHSCGFASDLEEQ